MSARANVKIYLFIYFSRIVTKFFAVIVITLFGITYVNYYTDRKITRHWVGTVSYTHLCV